MTAGRPAKYKDSKQLSKAIDHYFNSITITEPVFKDIVVGYEDEEQKKPIYDKIPALNNAKEQIIRTTYIDIPSITGLCQHLGISRETWNNYESKGELLDTIKMAKERIEKYNVEQLYRKDQVTGIIFNLKNNFGWVDKQEIEQVGQVQPLINVNVLQLQDGELKQLEQLLSKALPEPEL